jgi:hypothetical protein
MRILSVDWDFFFPELSFDPQFWMLYDWGHRDGGSLFLDQLWYNRAAGFLLNDLPLPTTTGEEKNFWNRFQFKEDAKLFFADSHSHIYAPAIHEMLSASGFSSIENFDAHHDAGYKGKDSKAALLESGQVTCENWALAYYLEGIRVRTFYPTWKKWAFKGEGKPGYRIPRMFDSEVIRLKPFDHIFVCRSGGWTPSWLDGDFEKFLAAAPVHDRIELAPCANRNWDTVRMEQYAEMQRTVRADMAKLNSHLLPEKEKVIV